MSSGQRMGVVLAAAAGGVVLLVVWVAAAAPVHVWHAPTAPSATEPALPFTPPTATATPPTAPTNAQQQGLPTVVSTTVLIIFAAALVALLVGMLLAREWRRRRTRRAHTVVLPDVDAPEVLEVPEEVTRTVEEQIQSLRLGPPRNAIVECWLRLEEAVARAGLEPDPAETSMELTTRVLARYAVGDTALAELAGLYREARFSTHPLQERHREAAIAALTRIRTELARGRTAARESP